MARCAQIAGMSSLSELRALPLRGLRALRAAAAGSAGGPGWASAAPAGARGSASGAGGSALRALLGGASSGAGANASAAAAAAGRRAFAAESAFQPSRLYPKQRHRTPEDSVFWGIVGLNIGMMAVAADPDPMVRSILERHFTASVASLADGRLWTLATSTFANASAVHCAMSLAALALFRRVPAPLPAGALAKLYVGGGAAGALAHCAYYWLDAGGLTYGREFADHTPGMLGGAAGVAAVLTYKLFAAPTAVAKLLFIPVPLLLAQLLFLNIHVRERGFHDGPPARLGGAAFGLALALAHAAGRRRAAAAKAVAKVLVK